MERKTPIVVGVGDIVNRSKEVGDAIEPLQLIIQAIRTALADTALDATAVASLQCDIDSVDIVRSWTWPYPDLAGLVSEHLDIRPHRKYNSEHGGNQPAYLFDEAARRISRGEGKVTVVAGGEALASCTFPFFLSLFHHSRNFGGISNGSKITKLLSDLILCVCVYSGGLRRSQQTTTAKLDAVGGRSEFCILAHHPRA